MPPERTVAGGGYSHDTYHHLIALIAAKFFLLYFILTLLSSDQLVEAFCHPGCQCADELRTVECINITSIPILFHPMLRSLTVRQSPLLALDSVSIGLYQELEFLDLSTNGLREIPDGFFNSLKKLRDLRLRANRLSAFDPRTFGLAHRHHVSSIQDLDLSDNEIEKIVVPKHHDSASLTLRALNLSGNRLHHLEPFGRWTHGLRILDLSRNRIAAVGPTLFNQTGNLESLDLFENILSEINAKVFERQRSLTRLDLARNLIADFDASAFVGLKSLRELNIANCMISNLTFLSRNWRHLSELRRLTLSGNPIRVLEAVTFDGLYALEVLTLDGMPQLRTVKDSSLGGLISLRELTLSDSPLLDALPVRLFGERRGGALPPARLQRLDLSDNALTTVDVALLDGGGWTQLEALNLSGNRWRCDCALLSFVPRALASARTAPLAFCSSPDLLFNVEMREVKHAVHCSSSAHLGTPLFALLTVAAAVLAALTALMATTALLCCCCWKYQYGGVGSQSNNAQKHYHNETTRSRWLFGRLTFLPLLRRCEKMNGDETAGEAPAKMRVALSAATASTSSSSAASNTSTGSYGNQTVMHDTSGAQMYYDKAADSSCQAHGIIIPYDEPHSGDGNEYYSCIPTGAPIDASTFTSASGGDYCLPPPNNYCIYGGASTRAAHAPLIAYGNGKSQCADTLAYPPYLYHSTSTYGMRTGSCSTFCAAADTPAGCYCGTPSVRHAPSFVAPPPPTSLPPTPTMAAGGYRQTVD